MPLIKQRVGHAGDAAVAADVGRDALERHHRGGTGVLGDLRLLGVDDVHDHAALEHLGQAGLDAESGLVTHTHRRIAVHARVFRPNPEAVVRRSVRVQRVGPADDAEQPLAQLPALHLLPAHLAVQAERARVLRGGAAERAAGVGAGLCSSGTP